MIYVDDFKMAGPARNMDMGRAMIQKFLDLDPPGPVHHCLGCCHRGGTAEVEGKPVRVMEYDVCDSMQQCVESYKHFLGGI